MSTSARAPLTPISRNIPTAAPTAAAKPTVDEQNQILKFDCPAVKPFEEAEVAAPPAAEPVAASPPVPIAGAELVAARASGRWMPVRDVSGRAIWSPADSLVSPATKTIWGKRQKKTVPTPAAASVPPTVLHFETTE